MAPFTEAKICGCQDMLGVVVLRQLRSRAIYIRYLRGLMNGVCQSTMTFTDKEITKYTAPTPLLLHHPGIILAPQHYSTY